jgi:hypothetical protein
MTSHDEFLAEIVRAIESGRDVYIRDVYVCGRDQALKVLAEQRDGSGDPEEAGLFAEIIRRIEHPAGL